MGWLEFTACYMYRCGQVPAHTSFSTLSNVVHSIQRATMSHLLQVCYFSFKSIVNRNTCLSSGKGGGGKTEKDLSITQVSSKMCLLLWLWPLPEGCRVPIYFSWPWSISLELIPFTCEPLIAFLPMVSHNFGVMLSQVCGVLVSLFPFS